MFMYILECLKTDKYEKVDGHHSDVSFGMSKNQK